MAAFALACLVWSLAVEATAAQRRSVRLRYAVEGAVGDCPGRTEVKDAVTARLGYRPWSEQADRTVVCVVGRRGGVLTARVELRSRSAGVVGTRELQSKQNDCRELAAAVVLAIAIAIDPLSTAPPGEPPPPPPPASRPATRPTRPGPATPATPASRPARRPPAGVRLSASASIGGLLAIGAAPGVAGGFFVQGRLRRGRFSLAVEGRFDLPASDEVEGGEVSASLMLGSVVPCFHLGPFLGCGLICAGALRGAGHGLASAANVTVPYWAVGARLGAEFPLFSVVALRISADLLGTLSRISLRDSETKAAFWTTPPVSGALGLGLVGGFL